MEPKITFCLYLDIMADIEKTISTKVEENYFQSDCEKIVSEKKSFVI